MRKGLNNCLSHPNLYWVFKNQQIVSGILTQQNRFIRAESNMLSDEKDTQHGDPGSCLVINPF